MRDSLLPHVAVIIVNWNSGHLLADCLEAVCRQTLAPWRVIVVDNGSNDESATTVQARFPDVDVRRLGQNRGFAAANNLAISELEDCEWIALLNPDAFAEPDWLEHIVTTAQAETRFSFFASRMLMVADSNVLDGTGDIYHVSGYGWRRGHGRNALGRDMKTEEIFSACAGAALYSRSALTEIEGFDESYFCYFEDMDLGFRLRLMGHRCLYVPDAVVHHVGSAITGKRSDFTVYHGHRNLVWTYFKNMPWPLFWLYLPQHALFNMISIIWFSLRGQGRVILMAKWDALKGLPRVLQERRKVQAARKVGTWRLRRIMAKGLLTPYRRRTKVH